MKKSSFVALILGTAGGVFFALGMCMALLPEWGLGTQGVVWVLGALLLGVGMCMSMVFEQMILGIVVGLIGIAVLLMLIPLLKGIHD